MKKPDAESGDDDGAGEVDADRPLLHWLDPEVDKFSFQDGHLTLALAGDETPPRRVFLIRTFPATQPDEYISVRAWNDGGDDDELGLIRNLADWSEATRSMIVDALDRRYLLRRITKIHSLKLDFGFLEFDVETAAGRQQFTTRWTQSKALTFGDNGRLLIDTDDNRYVVENVDALAEKEREVFLQYVYW